MGSSCFPTDPDGDAETWLLEEAIIPELADCLKGLKPGGTADNVLVADLVFGTEDLREVDVCWDEDVVVDTLDDVEPA